MLLQPFPSQLYKNGGHIFVNSEYCFPLAATINCDSQREESCSVLFQIRGKLLQFCEKNEQYKDVEPVTYFNFCENHC